MFNHKTRTLSFMMALMLAAQLLLQSTAIAQSDQGRLVGTVRDTHNAVVAGATLTIKNERTGEERSINSTEQGQYLVTNLKPSLYTVSIKAAGFADAQYTSVQVSVGQEVTLDIELKPAGTSESVTVVGTEDPAIDTSSARLGTNVNQREVQDLPLNGRQLSQLYLQAPGSVNTGTGTFFDIRFSGRSNEQNAIRYDGVEGTAIIDASPGNINGEVSSPFRLQTSLENIQEFRVDSNGYPAEMGTGTGGQISVVSKSGGNHFHGSLFEYVRNNAFDARNFFDLKNVSPLRLNQFGASVGGPIVKDRFFFFASYEGYRLRSASNIIEAVPSAAAAARAVPAIRPLIAGFRGPGAVTLAGASSNPDFDIIQLTALNRVDENAGGLRLDYKITPKHSLYARYYRDQGENNAPEGVTGRVVRIIAWPQNAALSLQSLLTPNVINEAKFGFNEALTRINGVAPTINGIDFSAITLNISGSVANTGIPGQGSSSGIAVPGGLVRANSATNGRGQPYTPYSLSAIDNLSWVRGNHAMKFGGEIRWIRLYTDRQGGTTYTFSNLNDFLANRLQSVQYAGDLSDTSPFTSVSGTRKAEQQYYIGFAQDEWKIRPNLTLSYGLRYEYYTPLREAHDALVLFDITNGTLRDRHSDPFQTSKKNFGPRVAVTWSPNYSSNGFFGGGRTVLRGGFGIYYGPGQTEDQIQPIESDVIRITQSGGNYPASIPTLRANFVNNPLNRSYQPRAYSPLYEVPERIYQYSFSVQQELFYKMVLTAAYVGSQGRNLFLRSVTNQIVSVRQNGTVIREFDIVNPDGSILRPYAEIDFKTSGGHDSYNALQVQLSRRFSTGLTLNSQYTFAKSTGTTSGSNDALTSGNLARRPGEAPNGNRTADFSYDEGYNNFDVRHSFNVSALYALPIGKGRAYLSSLNGIGEAILGGWEVGTIINARSGTPINVLITRPDVVFQCSNNTFVSSATACPAGTTMVTAVINTPGGGSSRNVRRPDLIAGVNPFLGNDRRFLNPAAFAIPAPGTFGNLVRNSLHGPNFWQADLVMNKRFRLTETANVEFKAEFFNIFNHTNFANPPAVLPNALGVGTNLLQPGQPFTAAAAGSFGVLNSTVGRTVGLGTNRQIQFALRVNF
ncbi:MAG TPA: TonB-dependent receptor [Blastocatellia bacterium]|nr:TonB-dependent receptor [Blastocatellia bacterium]